MALAQSSSVHGANIKGLALAFACWKLLLLVVACASPGPGYDTSAQILLPGGSDEAPLLVRLVAHVAHKLVRWDALYFVDIAHHGYRFEQEWAFGWGHTRFIALVANVLPLSASMPPLILHALVGTAIAHVSHFLSVLVLYALAWRVLPFDTHRRSSTAFVAAFLHIITPAGLFMSAPYTEPLFSLLNFIGMFLYSSIYTSENLGIGGALFTVIAAGACFGLATTVRSNGLLSGLIFAYAILARIEQVLNDLFSLRGLPRALRFVIPFTVAGLLTAGGSVLPQYIAFREYCLPETEAPRPWCSHLPPSVFSYVQKHYWNVGFLRYWTFSNLPLFLLALPMLLALLLTGSVAIFYSERLMASRGPLQKTDMHHSEGPGVRRTTNGHVPWTAQQCFKVLIRRFALPQVVLALLTFANFHVQIINRIATGYPIWYMVIAIAITYFQQDKMFTPWTSSKVPSDRADKAARTFAGARAQQWIVRSMVMYAIIQGGLYASFLPPA